MAKDSSIRISRTTQRAIIDWLHGDVTLDRLCGIDLQELTTGVFALGLEAYLLWRMPQLPAARPENAAAAEKLRTILEMRCTQSAALNLRMDAEARRMCAEMHAAGIRVMLLKGAALRARYPELAGRAQVDTDVLIAREDLTRAESIFLAAGYSGDETVFTREQYLDDHFHLRMIRGGDVIELHWVMSSECAPGGTERTWERAERIDWDGVPVWLPSIEDQLVYTQVHISRHVFSRALRWFGDMLFEVERWPDIASRLEIARGDWPDRMVDAPVKVARDLWPSLARKLKETDSAESRLDDFLLCSLARAALFRNNWCGIPCWYFEPPLEKWLTQESGSLFRSVVRTIAAHAFGKASAPAARP